MQDNKSVIFVLIDRHHDALLAEWLARQRSAGSGRLQRDGSALEQSRQFLHELRHAATRAPTDDIGSADWATVRDLLEDISRDRANDGFSPTETATFLFSLKEPLFELLSRELSDDPARLSDATWFASSLLDRLGLFTVECYQKTREDIIGRQQQELLELSTPVVELWDGILALPLIGTLDSARTQIVMESLLERIVGSGAEIAIIDITGVPTVDTLVAQHLIKTISAARLMGADCILSGIRPQIAQTIVHLGLELNVISKATMADALALALRRTGKSIVNRSRATQPDSRTAQPEG
jgi:rsbT co-antagonist protein RsbR